MATNWRSLKNCMMEDFERNEDRLENNRNFRDEVYSVPVRAGKRTYFFDVKSTRRDELYLTITESKKRFEQNGSFHFEKHKIFLYQEDFNNFMEGLQEALTFIDQNQQYADYEEQPEEDNSTPVIETEFEEAEYSRDFTKLDFDDLSS
jgi:hypothetical protein